MATLARSKPRKVAPRPATPEEEPVTEHTPVAAATAPPAEEAEGEVLAAVEMPQQQREQPPQSQQLEEAPAVFSALEQVLLPAVAAPQPMYPRLEPMEAVAVEGRIAAYPALDALLDEPVPQLVASQVRDWISASDLGAQVPVDEFRALVVRFRRVVDRQAAAQTSLADSQAVCLALEGQCWAMEDRTLTLTRMCEHGTSLTETHRYQVAVWDAHSAQSLERALAALREAQYRGELVVTFDMDTSRRAVEAFLRDFFADHSLGHAAAAASQASDTQLPVALCMRYFLRVLADEMRETVQPTFHHVAREWFRTITALLLGVASRADHLFLARLVASTPHSGWAAYAVQGVSVFQRDTHVELAMQLLDEVLTPRDASGGEIASTAAAARAASANDADSDELSADWVFVVSDEDTLRAASVARFIQSQDDFEALFAQVPLARMAAFVLRPALLSSRFAQDPAATLQVGIWTLRRLLRACAQFFAFDHFARVLVKASIRVLRLWVSELRQRHRLQNDPLWAGQMDALCWVVYTALVALPHAWPFLADLPFEACSEASLRRLVLHLVQRSGGSAVAAAASSSSSSSSSSASFEARLLGSARAFGDFLQADAQPLQSATHLLSALSAVALLDSTPDTIRLPIIAFLVDVGFVVDTSSAVAFKVVRSLLGSICQRNAPMVSVVIQRLALGNSWSAAAFVLNDVPLASWTPTDVDLSVVHKCLNAPPNSDESRFARKLVDGLDLDWVPNAWVPALPPAVHRRLALMAAEVMRFHDDAAAGTGSAWTLWRRAPEASRTLLYAWLWELAERTKHTTPLGELLLEPVDLAQPDAVALRPRDKDASNGDSNALAAHLAIAMVRFASPLTTIPALLQRLLDNQRPAAFLRSLATAAPTLAALAPRGQPVPTVAAMIRQALSMMTAAWFTAERGDAAELLLAPVWRLVGLAKGATPTALDHPLAVVVARQLATVAAADAAATGRPTEAAVNTALFWLAHLTAPNVGPGWLHLAELRHAVEAVLRVCRVFGVCASSVASEWIPGPAELPRLEPGWIPASVLGFAFLEEAEVRARLVEWAKAFPWTLFEVLFALSRKQAADWRALARATDSETAVPAPRWWAIQLWAVVCEASGDTEPLLLYWQLFFSHYFERSPLGRTFAFALLVRNDALLVSRLALALEKLSAQLRSSGAEDKVLLYNAMSLWLRDEGDASALVAQWNSAPSPAARTMLQTFAVGTRPVDNDEALWTHLMTTDLTATRRACVSHLRRESVAGGGGGALIARSGGVVGVVAPLFAEFASGAAQAAPDAADVLPLGPSSREDGWAQSEAGLRGAIEVELTALYGAASTWVESLNYTTALHHELLEALPGRYANREVQVVRRRPCDLGPLACVNAAQFAFRASEVQLVARVEEQLAQVREMARKALPPAGLYEKAANAAVQLHRRVVQLVHASLQAGAGSDAVHALGKETFYRLVDMALDAPFPPLVDTARQLCEELARAFVLAVPERAPAHLLRRILDRSDRAPLLLPFFRPHDAPAQFVAMYAEVADSKLGAVRASLLERFAVAQWIGTSPLEERSAFCASLVRRLTPGDAETPVWAVHFAACAAVVRYKWPQLGAVCVRALVEAASVRGALAARAWRLLLDGELCRSIRDPVLAESMAASIRAYLWSRRGLANPPRSAPLANALDAGMLAELAQFVPQLAECSAFQEPGRDETYGLLRAANPAQAWHVFVELAQPFICTLGVHGLESRPSQATIHFPPWLPNDQRHADEAVRVVRECVAPVMARLASRAPGVVLRLAWDLVRDVGPHSPPHVQAELLPAMAALPWNQLSVADMTLATGLGDAWSGAGFPSPALLNCLCAVVAQLPMYAGAVDTVAALPGCARAAWTSLAHLVLACDDVDASPLGPLVARGLQLVWQALPLTTYVDVLDGVAVWLQRNGQKPARAAQLERAVQLVEQCAAPNDALKQEALRAALVQQWLPCAVVPRPVLQGVVRRLTARALAHSHATGSDALLRGCCLLFNHPEYSFAPGIEAALDAALERDGLGAVATLRTLCAVVSSPEKLALAAERALEAYFRVAFNWAPVVEAFRPPELDELEFLDCCVRNQCVLVLFVVELRRAPTPSQGQRWLRAVTVSPSSAWKMVLLWALHLVRAGKTLDVAERDRLCVQLADLGRDSDARFALTALLGLGEKSPYPAEYRLFVRLLRVFVLLAVAPASSEHRAPLLRDARAAVASLPQYSAKLEPLLTWLQGQPQLELVSDFVQTAGSVLAPPGSLFLQIAVPRVL